MLSILLLITAVSASAASSAWYVVRKGDYLGRIAERTGTTVRELKRDNGLRGDIIYPGQKLRLDNPLHRRRRRDLRWLTPVRGSHHRILRRFGTQRRERLAIRRTGTDLAVPAGTAVRAPETGVVRYLGEQDGYGLILILEHGAGYATVLGPFDPGSLKVETGQVVLRGDPLGETGPPADGNEPYLHVELRRDNEAVDPGPLLP